jgi:hypothetical protein
MVAIASAATDPGGNQPLQGTGIETEDCFEEIMKTGIQIRRADLHINGLLGQIV